MSASMKGGQMKEDVRRSLSHLAGPSGSIVVATFVLGLLSVLTVSARTNRPLPTENSQERPSRYMDKDEQWTVFRSRDKDERPNEIIQLIGVMPGMRIGEAGAGTGYFTFFLSEKVGKGGIVYANDISKSFLAMLEYNVKRFGLLKNIFPVLGLEDDPGFPERDLDMIVTYDSFHDIRNRDVWLRNAVMYLKPQGTLAIIDGYWPKHGALTLDGIRDFGARIGFRLGLHRDLTFGGRSHHVHVLERDR